MEKVFLSVLNMSLTASFVIAAITVVRLTLKKAPKSISYVLWAVAGFRLVFPFTLESVFSLLPFKSTPIPQDIALQVVPRIDSGIAAIDDAVSASLLAAVPYASVNPLQIWIFIGSCVWLFCIAVMLVYSSVSIILLKRSLRGAAYMEANIYEVGSLRTPFVIGIFSPKIYIPAELTGEERRYIVLHEQTHIRRCDHIIKMLSFFILCLHWFNPLVWAAFILMASDMEMSCDERVMRELGVEIKNAYSLSLVRVAAGRKILNGCPLAFGEGGMKERIKNVLNFKKPSRAVVILATALAALLSVGFAFNRADKAQDMEISLGTFVLENITEQQSFERMTSFTLYSEGTASFNMAFISSYIPPKCTFAFENNELVFRAVIKTEWDRSFFGLEDNSIVAKFSAPDKNTLVFLSAEIPLFAEPGGRYVHIPDIAAEPFAGYAISDLSALRTPYVGDNSAVGRIVGSLPSLDEEHTQRFFSIGDDYGTGRAPFTLTLYYEPIDAEADPTRNLTLAPKNAVLLFALIDNLEEVTFAFRKTPADAGLDKSAYASSVMFSKENINEYLTGAGLSWTDFQNDWNGSVEKLFKTVDNGAQNSSAFEEAQTSSAPANVSEPETVNSSNFTDVGIEPGMVTVPVIADGSVIRIVSFETGDICSLFIEIHVPTDETDENSGAVKYEVVRNTKLLLPADVLVDYIDYESSAGTNGKKLISYLVQGGSYFPEPTIARLIVHTDEKGKNIIGLTEIYAP